MKKQNILNLIKHHVDNNDSGFRVEAYEVAKHFDRIGEHQLSEYIMALLSNVSTFSVQTHSFEELVFLEKVDIGLSHSLPLPKSILDEILGLINAINHNTDVNKFLFEGAPGTGKTESVKHLARVLNRDLYVVNFEDLLDSKLGQTIKNIADLFNEISIISSAKKVLVLFDEIDVIAIDRINSNDVREMGRATSAILKSLDKLSHNAVVIATTNLFKMFDKALVRRFDAVVNFDKYSKSDLLEVALSIANSFLDKYKHVGKSSRLLRKIFENAKLLPSPGELKNLIRTSIAFSDPSNEFDYIRRIYLAIEETAAEHLSVKELKARGYTVREIEIITGIPKSSAARELMQEKEYE